MYARHLRGVELFQGLTAQVRAAIAQEASLRSVQAGNFFFHQGDPATVLYVLIEGRVKFTQVTPEGHSVLLRVSGPGEMFGAVAALGDAYHPATGQAVTPCKALGWSSEGINALMEQYPRLALNAIRFLAGRVSEFQDRYRELATQRVERRVAHALLRLMHQIGREAPGGTQIDLAMSRQDIAEMTGTTLFTASRLLNRWEAEGIISTTRAVILVRRPNLLAAIAEETPPPTL